MAQSGDFTYTQSGGKATITAYTGAGGAVTIPDTLDTYPVVTISTSAFNSVAGHALTSVIIPSSVTLIGGSAFNGCTLLTSVTIPDSVTSISGNVFLGCTGLTSVTLPSGITKIDDGTFQGCTGLTSIIIPSGVTTLHLTAFYGCTHLTSVTIPNSVTTIDAQAFQGCAVLTDVTIPSGVTAIGDNAFKNCSALVTAHFHGNAPATWGATVFTGVHAGFVIYYYTGATGWSNPFSANNYTTAAESPPSTVKPNFIPFFWA